MMNYRTYLLPVTAVALLFLLGACSGEERKAAVANAPGAGAAAGPVATAGPLSVSIIPGVPTVDDELVAMVSGSAGQAAYRWEVDGQSFGEGDRIDASLFSKGHEVTLSVTTEGGTGTASTVIVNALPEVESVEFRPAVLRKGADITAEAVGYDPDGDFISYRYQWFVNGEEIFMVSGPVLASGHYEKGGEVTLKVTPFDGEDEGEAFISKPESVKNTPPRFTSVPPASFKARVYSYDVEAVDPDGDALDYTLVEAPEGMTIDDKGLITWPVGPGDNGTHSVEIAVDDGFGIKDTQRYEITIELSEK